MPVALPGEEEELMNAFRDARRAEKAFQATLRGTKRKRGEDGEEEEREDAEEEDESTKRARQFHAIKSMRGLKAGDWICPHCLDHQLAKNPKCRNCKKPRPDDVEEASMVTTNPTGKLIRIRICNYFLEVYCPKGEDCNFAHGEEQLGTPITDLPLMKSKKSVSFQGRELFHGKVKSMNSD